MFVTFALLPARALGHSDCDAGDELLLGGEGRHLHLVPGRDHGAPDIKLPPPRLRGGRAEQLGQSGAGGGDNDQGQDHTLHQVQAEEIAEDKVAEDLDRLLHEVENHKYEIGHTKKNLVGDEKQAGL